MKKYINKTFTGGILAGIILLSVTGFSYAAWSKVDVDTKPAAPIVDSRQVQDDSLSEKNVPEGQKMPKKEGEFDVIYPGDETQQEIPSRVQDWFNNHKKQAFNGTIEGEDGIYAAVTRGQQSNGGYGVEVVDVIERQNEVIVKVIYKNPAPGKMYTQVITYPATLIKIPQTDKSIRFEVVNE